MKRWYWLVCRGWFDKDTTDDECAAIMDVVREELHDRLAHDIETHANESAQELKLSGAELIAEHTGRPMRED